METMHFPMANGETIAVTAYENPVGDVGTAPSANHLQRGSLAGSTSSVFFKNRLVANIGVRYDRVRNSNFGAFQPIRTDGPITPQNPLGATMVSSEGACAAYYAYGRHLESTSFGEVVPRDSLVPLHSVSASEGGTR